MSPLTTALPDPARHGARRRHAAHLAQLLRLLYPYGVGRRAYLVLPHPRAPRLLVPATSVRAAAGAARLAPPPRSALARVVRAATAGMLRSGAPALVLRQVRVEPAGSIEAHLYRVLGFPAQLAIHIGATDRKPVLQLLHPDGTGIGFAKLATGPLRSALVRTETVALLRLREARLHLVRPPQLFYAGQWHEHELLIQSALPTWRRRVAWPAPRLARAMRELAYCQGVVEGPLAASGYWHHLRARVDALANPGGQLPAPTAGHPPAAASEAGRLAAAVAALAGRASLIWLRYGVWHGDWAPRNMVTLADTVLLWDWERFGTGVPIGFDALHYALQQRLERSSDAARAARETLARAPALLAPFDVPAAAATVTGLIYLVELATRYLSGQQPGAATPPGALGSWLLPVLLGHLEIMG